MEHWSNSSSPNDPAINKITNINTYYKFITTASDKALSFKLKNAIFSYFSINICCGYLLEVPRRDASNEYPKHMMCNAWKGPFCHLQTMQTQISLHECAGWSGLSLSAYRINGYCSICQQTENAQMRLHRCVHTTGPSLFAYGIRGLFCMQGIVCFHGEIRKNIMWIAVPVWSYADMTTYLFYKG